jgi:sulfur-oxidizing protein SoxY
MLIPRRLALGGLLAVALIRPGRATPEMMREAIREFAGEATIRPGRVTLDIPPLVENGNSVPLLVTVESPMTAANHVRAIAVFNEANPQPNVITAQLGPRAGRARLATRMRLGNTQRLTAIAALSDGSFWSDSAEVIVTLAACIEG